LSAPTNSSSVLFHDTFSSSTPSSAWSFVGGTWQINNGVLTQTSTAAADPKKAMIRNQTYPSNLMITAEVRVNSWNAGDMARAGIGLYTNTSNGDGYNLVFHGTNQVQFLDDKVTWGKAYTFNWQVGTWYWFQLAENNGTLEGKVWAAGTAEPQSWMFQQTGWTDRTGGAPALNGGSAGASAGSSTVSFASVSVTTTSVQPDTASAGSASTLPSPIAGTNYQLVFDDEFNGTSIDASKWNQVGPWGLPVASPWSGHFTYPSFSGNFSNVSEANGLATITIHNTGGGPGGTWTGGVLSTNTAKYFTYGFFEARVKLPAAGNGIWPAFWLVGGNGEIDIMEFFGYDATTIPQTLMPQHQVRSSNADWTQDYHLFQALWTPTRVTFYIDNVQTGSFASPAVTIPAQPMTMILNFDVGPWAGSNPPSYLYPNSSTPTTAAMNIDYVRVYQQP